ncbi:hypothetical protein SBADM41S_08729 [Streptomyces badius]
MIVKDVVPPFPSVSGWAFAPSTGDTDVVLSSAARSTAGKPFRVHCAPWLVSVTVTLPVSPAAWAAAPTSTPRSPIAQAEPFAGSAFFASSSPVLPSSQAVSRSVAARAAARVRGKVRMGSSERDEHERLRSGPWIITHADAVRALTPPRIPQSRTGRGARR